MNLGIRIYKLALILQKVKYLEQYTGRLGRVGTSRLYSSFAPIPVCRNGCLWCGRWRLRNRSRFLPRRAKI